MSVNTRYKDGMFRALFNTPEKALKLYEDITGKVFDKNTTIEMKTVDSVFLSMLRNDLAFTVNGVLIVIIEHQSTLNKNMPLRILQYLLALYELYFKFGNALYKEKLIKIPKPDFYVLYNGEKHQEPSGTLRLSDSFIGLEPGEEPQLELIINIVNINLNAGNGLLEKNSDAKGYALFLEYIRGALREGKTKEEAIRHAMERCINEGILADFFNKNKNEVEAMFSMVYDEEMAKQVAREEGFEDGWEGGKEEGQEKIINILELLTTGLTPEEASIKLNIPIERVLKVKAFLTQDKTA